MRGRRYSLHTAVFSVSYTHLDVYKRQVTGELEIYRMEIGEEIEPGVPAMTGTTNLGELQLVLKSGSFGSEFFLEKAARYLQGERAYDCKQED